MEAQVRLHGRDELIEHVVTTVDPPRAPGASVLLEGDAGVGKTALIEVVAARVGRRRRLLVGHCVGEVAGTLSYLPFVEAFGRLDAAEPDTVDGLVEAYPSLAAFLPRRAVAEGDEGDWSRIVEAVHGGLELLAERQPTLLVVEDIHWADESTRELLTLLFTRGFAGPVSVLASYRSDDLHRRHPLRSSLAVWSRLRVARVEVPPLAEEAMRALVQEADDRLDEDTVADIVGRSGGNAFFAEEMVAAVGTGTSDDLGRLLLRRLDALGEDAQDVVRRAAVVGRRVGHHLLLASTGIDAAHLDRLLREIVDHHILEPTRDGGYIFRHALLAEAVYDDLLPGEIVRHHCACADALRRQPELGTHADLARHAIAAHDTDLAIDSSEAAGRAAGRMGGPAEALRHFENALSLMADDDERVHRLTMEAAAAAIASGRVAVALSRLRAGLRRRDATPRERAELLARLAGALHFSDESTDRVAIVDEALALLPPSEDGEDDLRVDLLTRRIEALWHVGRAEEVLVHAEEIGRRGPPRRAATPAHRDRRHHRQGAFP
ncbi:ATP-binding protein [Mobilicoccus caccae]|nr:AAA family ATPase [Mobilicoccus caccae]